MGEYSIDELARLAGTSVRNVRVYQERGLLPPPRRVGRSGVYDDLQLERLRRIRLLLLRGYTFTTIAELLNAADAGVGLDGLLWVEQSEAGLPLPHPGPVHLTRDQFRAYFDDIQDSQIDQCIELGLVIQDEADLIVPHQHLMEAAALLSRRGMPISVLLELTALLNQQFSELAAMLMNTYLTVAGDDDNPQRVADHAHKLLPSAVATASVLFHQALQAEVAKITPG